MSDYHAPPRKRLGPLYTTNGTEPPNEALSRGSFHPDVELLRRHEGPRQTSMIPGLVFRSPIFAGTNIHIALRAGASARSPSIACRRSLTDSMQVTATGLAWYAREDWAALKALFTDAHKLHANYDDWLKAAELGFKTMTDNGNLVFKVPIVPSVFAAWCQEEGIPPDSYARNKYGALKVRDIIRDQQKP